MAKPDLRGIAERLTRSKDTEALVAEFLGYLENVQPDWRASLAFYEVHTDSLVRLYWGSGARLRSREIRVPVDELPARLVRKFFHPSAFFNHTERRSLLSAVFQSSPYYEPDVHESRALEDIAPLRQWESCICLPLADREELMALAVLASDRKGAFPSRMIAEILPARSMAALALSQHLSRDRDVRPEPETAPLPAPVEEFQTHIRKLNEQAAELDQSNREKDRRLGELTAEVERLDQSSAGYRSELQQVRERLAAIEDQASAATDQLNQAYTELTTAQWRVNEVQHTVEFLKNVFQVLSQEHDSGELASTLVSWFCEHFGVDRCSLMVVDSSRQAMRIYAQHGMDPDVADSVVVHLGQGIAGWVAHNRKPLLVHFRNEFSNVAHTGRAHYNSESFVSVPLVHNNRLCGVLNLSNKRSGEQFTELDLERAQLAAGVLSMKLGSRASRRGLEVWT